MPTPMSIYARRTRRLVTPLKRNSSAPLRISAADDLFSWRNKILNYRHADGRKSIIFDPREKTHAPTVDYFFSIVPMRNDQKQLRSSPVDRVSKLVCYSFLNSYKTKTFRLKSLNPARDPCIV